MAYLNSNNLLHRRQHGFSMGWSSVTKMLTTDIYITNGISAGHPFNILTLDFKKTFVTAPRQAVLVCLSNLGVFGHSLRWFASFLFERTQTVRVGNSS